MTVTTPSDLTLSQARQYVEDNIVEGVECPCCDQLVKLYSRPMHAAMALVLVQLYRRALRGDFGAYSKVEAKGGDYAKLTAWQLIEQQPGERPDGSPRNGHWRITQRGADFVLRKTTLPRRAVWRPGGTFVRLEGEEVSIVDVLGEAFDYADLLGDAQ